jgi:hypothetical protein
MVEFFDDDLDWRSSIACMSASPCEEAERAERAELPGSVLYILRWDGLVLAALTLLLYAHLGASWWMFALLWLVPDLSMLGYLAGPFWGARVYNAVHAYATPGTLAACALALHADALLPFAVIWANHIAIDRLLGYGLKYPSGFRDTHLGTLHPRV